MSLSIALRQALHGLFSGTQALPENRGAYVSTHFWLKWQIHPCQGKMPNDLVEIWLSQVWVGIFLETSLEERGRNTLKMASYEKMLNMKVVRLVKTYNFAFGVIWIRHTL